MNKILEVTGSGSGTARYGVRRGEASVSEGHTRYESKRVLRSLESNNLTAVRQSQDSSVVRTTSPQTKLLCPGF